ncbi:MAG: M23 family metallopeptidase [Oscillospiraceae bacterium]|nr:M23 family metallopeptidase [Oscillospiraceae bacterium]
MISICSGEKTRIKVNYAKPFVASTKHGKLFFRAPYDLIWPMPGHEHVVAVFGTWFDPVEQMFVYRDGIDIAAPIASLVVASESGTIYDMGNDESDGYFITLEHGSGMQTCYANLHGLVEGLAIGDAVSGGDIIGYVGGNPYGAHLHFRVIKEGESVDPMTLFLCMNLRHLTNGQNVL